jgi:hypothetical protein
MPNSRRLRIHSSRCRASDITVPLDPVWHGKKEICIRNLEVLARAFEISVSQLMTRL